MVLFDVGILLPAQTDMCVLQEPRKNGSESNKSGFRTVMWAKVLIN